MAWTRQAFAQLGQVVVDGKLVTMLSDGASDLVAALDGATGEEIWRYVLTFLEPVAHRECREPK